MNAKNLFDLSGRVAIVTGGSMGLGLQMAEALAEMQAPAAIAEALRRGWFRTGDIAVIERNGCIPIVDRKKGIIVSGGENISSLDVEKVLVSHPDVYESAVISVPDKKWGEVPRAVVVVKPGRKLSETELIEFSRSRLAHYKCPHSIEFCDSLRKTATGKVLKRERICEFHQGHGDLWEPVPLLRRLAETRKTFADFDTENATRQ